MKVLKCNKKRIFVTFLVTVLFCAIFAFTGIFTTNKQTAEAKTDSATVNLDGSGGTISQDGLKQLYAKIASGATSYSDLSTKLGSSVKTAKEIATTVTLGGYKWNVVYASKTSYASTETSHVKSATYGGGSNAIGGSGDVVATLWLADTTSATAGIDTQSGYYWDAGGYSYYTSSVKTSGGLKYPTNMYSGSYIRSLLNGTKYANYGYSLGATSSFTTKSNVTISNGVQKNEWNTFINKYKNYISTPAQMGWQYTQNEKSGFSWSYDAPNSGLTATTANMCTSAYSSSETCNYTGFGNNSDKTGYANWGDDKLWLPSIYETGYGTSDTAATVTNSLWKTTVNQRSHSGSNVAWLRSGYGVYLGYAARPALHLNLKSADSSAGSTTEKIAVPAGTDTTYTGAAQALISGYDSAKMTATMTYNGSAATLATSATNAGTYVYTFTPKSGYEWNDTTGGSGTRSKTVKINKVTLTPSAVITSRAYNGGTAGTGTISLSGAVNGEKPTATGTFAWTSANAGTKTFNVTGITLGSSWTTNYALSTTSLSNQSGTNAITKVTLTPSAVINAKPYDGGTAGTGTISLSGAVNSESPTATGTFAWTNAQAGTKTFNVTGITLGSSWTTNYALSATSLSNQSGTNAIGKINQSPVISTADGATAVTYGSTLQFSVSGAFGTGTWRVSDTTAATISSAGVLTPLKGGVTVIVYYTAAGDTNYNASSEVSSDTIQLNKKQVTPSAVINAKPYDGTTAGTGTITLSGGVNGETPTATGSFSWSGVNAGISKYRVTGIKLADAWTEKYELSTTSIAEKSDAGKEITRAKINVPTAIDGVIYNGSSQNIISGFDANKMTATYGYASNVESEVASVADGTETTEWFATDAGVYTFKYTPKSNYCWQDGTFGEETVPATIAKAKPALSLAGDRSVEYGKSLTLALNGNDGNGAVVWSASNGSGTATLADNVLTATHAGLVTVSATTAATNNFEAGTLWAQTITINKATLSASIKYLPKMTFESKQTLSVNGNDGTGTVTWHLGSGSVAATLSATTGATVELTATTVGTIKIYAEIAETENYQGATLAEVSITVSEYELMTPVAAEAPEGGFVYDGQPKTLVSGYFAGRMTVTVSFNGGAAQTVTDIAVTDAGTYTFTFTPVGSYIWENNGGTDPKSVVVSIGKADAKLQVKLAAGPYFAGKALPSIVGIEPEAGMINLTGNAVWKNSGELLSKDNTEGYEWAFTSTNPNYKDAEGKIVITLSSATLQNISAVFDADKFAANGGVVYTSTADIKAAIADCLTVTALYDDESVNNIVAADADVTYTVSGTLAAGNCTLTVAYEGFTADITVPVTKVVPVKLDLTFNQGGTTVYSSDELSVLLPMISGVVVTYNDGTTAIDKTAADLTLSGSLSGVVAAYTEDGVTVENTTITVNVTGVGVSSITASLKSGVTLTDAQTALDLKKALSVRAEFADGNGRNLNYTEFNIKIDGVAANDGDSLTEGTHTVEVEYTSGGATVTDEVEFTVTVRAVKSIKANLKAGAKIYESSTDGEIKALLEVVVTYTDGTTAVAAGFEVSVSNLVAGGDCEIIVSYAGLTDSVNATVLSPASGTLNAALKAGSTVYSSTTMEELAQMLDVTLDGTPVEGFTVSGDLVAGKKCTVKVSYSGLSKYVEITVANGVYVIGLDIEFEQNGAIYFEGDSIEILKDVITVNAIYSDADNTKKVVTGYTLAVVTGGDKFTKGNCVVRVSYEGQYGFISKDIVVDVTEVVLVGLEGEFKQNGKDVFTSDGLEVIADGSRGLTLNLTAVYNNGTRVKLALGDLDLTSDGLDANDKFTAGTRKLAAAYTDGGKTVEFKFELNVTAVVITSIEVKLVADDTKATTLTTKDQFLNLITVTATYNDGSKAPLSASLCGSDFVVGKVGEQEVTVNYGVVKNTVKITVEKVKAEIVADGLEYTYDGTKTTQTVDSGAKLVYNGVEISGVTLTYSDNTFTDVPASGTIEITVSFAGDGIYDECEKKVTVTVKKAVYDMDGVEFSQKNYKFDYDPAQTRSASLLGTLPAGVTCTVTYKDAAGNVVMDGSNPATSVKNAGTYTVVASFTGDSVNYEAIGDITAEIVIDKITASVDVSGISKGWTYDGQEHGLGGAVKVAGENGIKYVVDGTEYEENEFKIKDAANYEVTVVIAESDNYKKVEAKVTVAVAKAKLEIKPEPKKISYGTDPYDGEYTSGYKGFELTGENADDLEIKLDYSFNYAKYGAVGVYVITVSVASGNLDNYEVTCQNGVLNVEQLGVDIDWHGTEVTFDGAAHKPAASFTDVYGNTVTLAVTLESTADGTLTGSNEAVDAGRYKASATNVNSNYKLNNPVIENFVINKAKIILAKSGDKWFDEKELYENPDDIITLDGLDNNGNYKYISIVGGDANAESVKLGYSATAYISATQAPAPENDNSIGSTEGKPAITVAGTYYVNFKIEAENHETLFGQWVVEIVKEDDERIRIVKIIFNKEYPIDYGDAPTTVAGREAFTKELIDGGYVTVEGMDYDTFLSSMIVRLAADTENEVDEYTIVKNYTIYFDFKSDKEAEFANYSVFYKRTNAQGDTNFGMLAIQQRKLTVTWGETNFDYDGNVHFPAVTVKGFIDEAGDVELTLTADRNGVYSYVVNDGENRIIRFTATVSGDLKSEGGSTVTLKIDNSNYVIENATATVSITVPDDNKIGISPLTIGIIAAVAALALVILITVIVVLKRKAARVKGGGYEDEDGFSDDYEG